MTSQNKAGISINAHLNFHFGSTSAEVFTAQAVESATTQGCGACWTAPKLKFGWYHLFRW